MVLPGGKEEEGALTANVLGLRPKFRNKGSRVLVGARGLVRFLVLTCLVPLEPETMVAEQKGG